MALQALLTPVRAESHGTKLTRLRHEAGLPCAVMALGDVGGLCADFVSLPSSVCPAGTSVRTFAQVVTEFSQQSKSNFRS
jgi:hypothetical protein